MVDEPAAPKIHFELVAGAAERGDAGAIRQHPNAASDRGAIREVRHRFADQAQAQCLHRDVAVHLRAHAELSSRHDDIAGSGAFVKTRIGLFEQMRDELHRIELATGDQAVRYDAPGVWNVVAELVAAPFQHPREGSHFAPESGPETVRGSVIEPVTADAATVAGLPR